MAYNKNKISLIYLCGVSFVMVSFKKWRLLSVKIVANKRYLFQLNAKNLMFWSDFRKWIGLKLKGLSFSPINLLGRTRCHRLEDCFVAGDFLYKIFIQQYLCRSIYCFTIFYYICIVYKQNWSYADVLLPTSIKKIMDIWVGRKFERKYERETKNQNETN